MRLIATLFIAATLLGGCTSTKRLADTLDSRQNAGLCPASGSLYDAARYVAFAPGAEELYNNITFTGEITDVRPFCRYSGGDPIVASIEIDFSFGKGEQAAGRAHTYPYFVAVTRRNGKVLAMQEFNVSGEFKTGSLAARTERVQRIEIPRMDESIAGENFEIIVGFKLDEKQLAFNRDGKRFRIGTGG